MLNYNCDDVDNGDNSDNSDDRNDRGYGGWNDIDNRHICSPLQFDRSGSS